MKENNNANEINRRKFLQTSATIASTAMLFGFGNSKLFGEQITGSQETKIKNIKLNNGVKMPILGFGTLTLHDEVAVNSVVDAIALGYRLIDTASIYKNEESVGVGIKKSGINREELFITSKLWVDDSGYEKTINAFELSLSKLGIDYLDLYLIHRPRGDFKGSWKAMEELYKEGRIKAIGVSNFEPDQLKDLLTSNKIKPAVNQIETHAYFQQPKAYDFLKDYGVQMEAWAPFAEGRKGLFTNEIIGEIGRKYNKSNAQVCLRWLYQRGIVAIPRSSQNTHRKENLSIFDFKLDESDLNKFSKLDSNTTLFPEWL